MDIKKRLSQRVGIKEIREIVNYSKGDSNKIKKIYNLLYDNDETIAFQAAWVMCHFSKTDNKWLLKKQNELIDLLLICEHSGKRRLILNLLLKQQQTNPPRTDFLDFCMERMFSKKELPGVQTICIKLAYKLCCQIPELLNVYIQTLELSEPDLLHPSVRAVIKIYTQNMNKICTKYE